MMESFQQLLMGVEVLVGDDSPAPAHLEEVAIDQGQGVACPQPGSPRATFAAFVLQVGSRLSSPYGLTPYSSSEITPNSRSMSGFN